MKILGFGLSGLVGSRVTELLSNQYEFESVSTSTGINLLDKEKVTSLVANSSADIVLHLAAKTDVDNCEEEKEKGKESEAWRVNVDGVQAVIDGCKLSGKKLIYISTDFVFDGEKDGSYTEEDTPHPINWYAQTKYEAELRVKKSGLSYLIVRIAYPYRTAFKKKDFVRAMMARLQAGETIYAIVDQTMTPTFIDDIVKALDILIKKNTEGIIHVVGSQSLSPYDAAQKIAEVFSLDKHRIKQISRQEFFKNKAQRPFNLSIRNDKIQKLGVRMNTFEEGLREIKKQL